MILSRAIGSVFCEVKQDLCDPQRSKESAPWASLEETPEAIYNVCTDGWTRPSKCNLVKKVD